MDARACIGCLLGTAVGDSVGLPYEGLSARRAARMFPGPPAHRLVAGRGMVSDDTEHACFTARALILSGGDADVFARRLAASLRWWLAGLPAGIGLATLRSILKSCIGFPPHRSGVFSAGNGPAMRSPILGVALASDPERLLSFVRASTRLTHTDPKALHGALAAALAARHAVLAREVSAQAFLQELEPVLQAEGGAQMLALARQAADSAARGEPVGTFAESIGSRGGITGYMLHTVPCVLHVWLRHPQDYTAALAEIVAAGGDTDTAGAILGGIVGARVGKQGIPAAWRDGILEWPRSMAWIERLGEAVAQHAQGQPAPVPGYFAPAIPVRNAAFMAIVLAHGFRRLAPPY